MIVFSVLRRAEANAEHTLNPNGENDDKVDDGKDDGNEDDAEEMEEFEGQCSESWPVIDRNDKVMWQKFGVYGTSVSSFTTNRTAQSVNLSTKTVWSAEQSWNLNENNDNVLEKKLTKLEMSLENSRSVKFLLSDASIGERSVREVSAGGVSTDRTNGRGGCKSTAPGKSAHDFSPTSSRET